MTFDEVLDQVRELLQQRGRVTYRALKRRFDLDDEYLEDLKGELIRAEGVAAEEDRDVLVWTGTSPVSNSTVQVSRSSQLSASQTADAGLRTPDAKPQTLDARLEGERRQLTVMFCDLVGSTALSTQLDPEELREVIQAYRETCATVIRRFEGYLAKYIGDGLLVYFGYPQAHEDDAQRAVRAGLGIVGAMQDLPLQTTRLQHPLQVRIGIHTGLVVAGEMGVGDQPEPLAIVGETPNIAARLQEKAVPNSVVISPTTYRLVTGLFECQKLGPQTLKGLSTPLTVYRVVRESEAQSRFEVAVSAGLPPLIGRDHEMGLLQERWTQAKGGAGQVVLLSGEAGIGKSRLVQTFKEQVMAEGATRIEFRCSPYHQHSAFYPIIEHLQRFLQFQREETPQAKLAKLQQALAAYRFLQADTAPLLAALLSLPHPIDSPALTLSPQRQRQKTMEAIVAWLREEAERRAVYNAWEDLHWADPSTLELLQLYLDQIPTSRVFTVLTFRPDFTPPWGARSYLSQLTLNRLGRQQVEAMVEQVTGGKALPVEVLRQIVSKTDGVPLFVEELTKMVLEAGLLTAVTDHYELRGPLPPLAIPSTLQDSLIARLDRLAPVREIAQVGATLGREFSYEVLQAVSPLAEAALQQGLRQLVEAELLYQRGLPPRATYLFKHALIQDAAYQLLLKSKRQQYHQQIARVLEERFTEIKETQPELVAHHYTEAGLIAQAIPYWQQAGQRAIQRSANVEAIGHFTKGLELLKTLPDTPERDHQELSLQNALGTALRATKGMAAPEAETAYRRAFVLCQQMEESPQLFQALYGLCSFHMVRAELQTARELAERLVDVAQNLDDPASIMTAHNRLGTTLFWLGELESARTHLERSSALYEPSRHGSLIFLYGEDVKVSTLSYLSWTLWFLGYPDRALQISCKALAPARELAHPYSLVFALYFAARLHQLRSEMNAMQDRIEELAALASEHGFAFWAALAAISRGWTMMEQGKHTEGITQLRQGLASYSATGAGLGQSYQPAMLADMYRKVGQPEEGLKALAEANTFAHSSGEQCYAAERCRLKGELTLQKFQVLGSTFQVPSPQHLTPNTQAEAEAEAYFRKAIEIARRQQAKSLELRAVISLSRLWQQQGKKEEARQMLAEIYGWFTEGFDTMDLQEAKALLEELV